MSSLVSTKGPSVTWAFPFLNRTLAPFELGCRPAPSTITPAAIISWLNLSMASRACFVGIIPASLCLSALTMIMKRMCEMSFLTGSRSGRIPIDNGLGGHMKAVAPKILSVLRLVSAFLFIYVGSLQMFGWPMSMPGGGHPALFSELGVAEVLEVFGGGL